jgi:molecular chaperone GrpE
MEEHDGMKSKERPEESLESPTAASQTESPEETVALREELGKKEEEVKEARDRYLRTMADFENFRKRAQKERVEQTQFANEKLIKEVLPVLDNIERAIAHSSEKDLGKILEGLELIQKQLLTALGKFGVTPIESLHQPFDPAVHQSIGQVESDGEAGDDEDRVASEAQKGYLLNDRVLRPSLVMISKKKTSAPDQTD